VAAVDVTVLVCVTAAVDSRLQLALTMVRAAIVDTSNILNLFFIVLLPTSGNKSVCERLNLYHTTNW
jgi:hypothetical protein